VADSGPGVPPANHETIFAPNFSTKRKGSGLGLAIARHRGGSWWRIRVGTTPRGARFVIDLPA
jgi:signal transduction histidine kinase